MTMTVMLKPKKQRIATVFVGVHVLHGVLVRRSCLPLIHHLFPLFSAVLLFLFAFVSFLSPPITNNHLRPQRRMSLHNGIKIQSNNRENTTVFRVPTNGGHLGRQLWSSRHSNFYYGCSISSDKFQPAELKTHPDRYLMIATSGGLNQQRTGITDAVVAAYILNATLIVPELDQKSYWKDSSNFSEIFDVEWFILSLVKDVKIIKQPPIGRGRAFTPYSIRVPRKCNTKCYESRLLRIFSRRRVVLLTKFDYRLSNRLEPDLQKLRCRANYHALRFTEPILEMGKKLVRALRMKSEHFIAVHLRFEPDMLAFSGCYYGGGEKERTDLGAIRRRWKTLHQQDPNKQRRRGKCPLTPEEVGLMLRALGFGTDVHIYVASGEIYGGENTLAPLKALFPNSHTKETIARKEELAPFLSFSSRMAALDFIVCDESDVFVTNNNGNMAKILAGRRRYFGHKPTIRPSTKKLSRLFMSRDNMTWDQLASGVQSSQIGFMGEPNEVKPGRGVFHENPSSCICEDSEAKRREDSSLPNRATGTRRENNTSRDASEIIDDQLGEDDESDTEFDENDYGLPFRKGLPDGTN